MGGVPQAVQKLPHAVTRLTFHGEIFWLNAEADWNMLNMVVTWEVSKLVNGWLNAEASLNMYPMSVTWEVSKLVNGWLNAEAP